MAYYNQSNDQDEDQLQQEAGQPISTSQASGTVDTGSGPSSDSASAAAGANQAKSAASRKPTFAGINDYLAANKTQAERLGQQVSGSVTGIVDNARQNIGNLQNEANEKIKGAQAIDPAIFNQLGEAEKLSQEQRDQFKNTANAQYQGPQDYTQLGESFTNAAQSSKEAEEALKNIGSETGRVQLLNQINGGRTNQGINTFDAALLSAGSGRQQLEQVAEQNKDLGDLFNTTKENITSAIGRYDDPNTPENEAAGAMGQTQQQSQAAQKAIQEALANWTSGFNPRVQTAQQQLIDQQNRVAQDLGGTDRYALTDETLQLLGLTEGMNTYGVDLNRFLQQADPSQINAANVATGEDYARYLALSELAGKDPEILKAGNEELAGTAPGINYNKEELQKAINEAKDPYLKQVYSGYYLGPLPANATLRTNSYGGIASTAGRNMTANDLLAAINDMEQNILPGAPGGKTTQVLTARLNEAKKIYNDFMTGKSHNGIGLGNATSIKKETN